MTTWTKISKPVNGRGLPPLTKPRLHNRPGHSNAKLAIPASMVASDRLDILHDGNGKIGLHFHAKGERKVSPTSGSGRTVIVSIPQAVRDIFPFGTYDADLADERGVLVLDTKRGLNLVRA